MKSAVMALSVSMILFVSMSGLKEIADGVQEYMTFDYGYSVVADYTANRKYTTNPETGRREEHAQMISSELAEEILSELSEYQGTEVYGSGVDYATYDTPLSSEELTPEVQKALEKKLQRRMENYCWMWRGSYWMKSITESCANRQAWSMAEFCF